MKTELKLVKDGYVYRYPVELEITEERITFLKSPFKLKDEIKAMKGSRWGGLEKPPRKSVWSVENHPRNVFQLRLLMGENPYEWWERPLIDLTADDFDRPVEDVQVQMVRQGLTYHYTILAAEQGLGKTLAAIEIMERSGLTDWWFVGPKSALVSVELEFEKWNLGHTTQINIRVIGHEELVNEMRYNYDNIDWPQGIFYDESSGLKNDTTHRATACQAAADKIRELHGFDGYVIELSGTPTAKHPTDIWSQAEIAWPGFLREGSVEAFEKRYAILEDFTNLDGITLQKRAGWNEEEVAKIWERMEGLMTVYRKKDWLDLPEKTYETIRLEPSPKVLRVASALCRIAPNTITALNWTRALSSGFQYVTKEVGRTECDVCKGTGEYDIPEVGICPGCTGSGVKVEYTREPVMVHTPKDDALRDILDRNETHGRLVVAASFRASIDRARAVAVERGWATVVVDGRGWRCYDYMGKPVADAEAMRFWNEKKGKVCFIGNPASCRFGITLTLAHTLVFYDNSFSAEHRLQMEDRIHRIGMGDFATIIDLVHLPVDDLVLATLRDNRDTELLSLGVINDYVGNNDDYSEKIDENQEEELLQPV